MTNQEHSITPPFELMNQWYKKACKDPYNGGKFIMSQVLKDICNSAARWGADQELEACCKWTQSYAECGDSLRAARRPKPPSLKEQALAELEEILTELNGSAFTAPTIRRALEALPND